MKHYWCCCIVSIGDLVYSEMLDVFIYPDMEDARVKHWEFHEKGDNPDFFHQIFKLRYIRDLNAIRIRQKDIHPLVLKYHPEWLI